MMGEEGDALVSEFVAFTGADVSQAKQMLEAAGDDLQSAIDLYFATVQKDEDVAQRLHEEEMAREPLQSGAEEHVRAPIPSRVDRLYGEYQPVDGLGSRPRARPVQGNSIVPIMDAFRQRSDAVDLGREGLASMFDPPQEILFQGSFEEAKEKAVADRRWLVLNVQSPSSFDSHRLNRDMWRDGTIQALLETSFVVYQTYDVSQDGESLMGYYAIDRLPVIIMVDPVTGAPMKHWFGFIEASRFAEDLVPFMDTHFDDPRAAKLAASSMKKRQQVLQQKVDLTSDMDAADADLQAAIEKSMEQAIRFPDGTRRQRRFPKSSELGILRTWCIANSSDAASGSSFTLAPAAPGAQPLTDYSQSLEDAGAADAMFIMKLE
eukprot:jgi/Picsp_1/1672/NSC_05146-R1_ubx domain-containing protein